MSDEIFLAYLPDPFGVRESIYHICSDGTETRDISVQELGSYPGLVVVYDSAILVEDMRRGGIQPPNQLVDLSSALRLCAGVPRDEGRDRRADVWSGLGQFFPSGNRAKRFKDVFESRCVRPNSEELKKLLRMAALAVRNLWARVLENLREHGELERFVSIEIPVQSIFHYRQYEGIAVDPNVASELSKEVADEKYEAYLSVASQLSRSPTGLNFWNIQPHLHATDMAGLADISDGGRLRDAFKIAAFSSKFASAFLAYSDADRDELVLMRAVGPDERLHPVFDVMGTVTGRILVSDPYLQQLRRAYRQVISSDTGNSLVYLDFCQFEPGILAYLAQDQRLIHDYNRGDIYTALSESIFDTTEKRAVSKRIFLAFCYGMSIGGIAKLLSAHSGEQEKMASAIERFFATYPGLQEYRLATERQLAANNYSSSLFGNRRWRTSSGNLTSKERRWALNQTVQATASLIFKEALISLAEKFGKRSILLPVHDAALMQFSKSDRLTADVADAMELMRDAFRKRCPGIIGEVSAGSFSS